MDFDQFEALNFTDDSDFVSVRCNEEGSNYCSKCTKLPSELQCGWCASAGICTIKNLCLGSDHERKGVWLSPGDSCLLEDIIGLLTIITIIGLMIILIIILYFIVLISDQIASTWMSRKSKRHIENARGHHLPCGDVISNDRRHQSIVGQSSNFNFQSFSTRSPFFMRPRPTSITVKPVYSTTLDPEFDNLSTPSSSFQGTMIFNRLNELKESNRRRSSVPRCYFKKYPSNPDPGLFNWPQIEPPKTKRVSRGSVMFYQTKEEISTKRCSIITTKTLSAEAQDLPFSWETSLVPTGNNQFYLVVQINVDPSKTSTHLQKSPIFRHNVL